MYDCNIRIGRTQNGFLVTITDPAIVKQNQERNNTSKGDCCAPWQDPDVKYSFETKEAVATFISENIDKALPVDEYSSTFDKAAKEASK